ncbi:heme-binding protein [Fibrella sp. HMF5335]|uniref:Heme-binding protein n=1 Tax=Fibrella rubiginis TaxID=2817060 RepID=A0A939GDD8_9BACT|nr:heme-binding protein [Fibrella rubiginis]MBO0935465.1 heme-binding protein [Fibrella rubiginis]
MQQQLIDQLIKAARQASQQQGIAITITLVDTGGHICAVWRQEGCSYFALESSRQKAVTASQLRIPSHVVGELGQKFPTLQTSFSSNKDISGLPGGFPVMWQQSLVGGLGISGGNFEQDQAIGSAVVASLTPAN